MKQYGLFMMAVFLTCFPLIGCRITEEADSVSITLQDRTLVAEETLPVKESTPAEETLPVEESTPAEETLPAEETTPAEETLPVGETTPIEETSPALQEAPFGKIETHRIKSPMLEPTTQALDDAPEWMEPTTMANGESPQYLPLE